MRLGEVNKTFSRQHDGPASGAAAERVECRALVALAPITGAREAPADHRQAQFLAHLIATKDHLPQTRERRRAEPGEALAAYRAVEAMVDK
jgi:hypothetical protein